MTHYHPAGSLPATIHWANRQLSPDDLERVGITRDRLYRAANPEKSARLTFDEAAKLDAALARRGLPQVFLDLYTQTVEAWLGNRPGSSEGRCIWRDLTACTTALGTLAERINEAMADGRLDLHEQREITKAAQEIIDRALPIRDRFGSPHDPLRVVESDSA